MTENSSDKTATNLRNLLILEALAKQGGPASATDLNATLNLPKPTIHRLVATLEAEGFLVRDLDGRSYLPGPRMRQMALGIMRFGSHSAPQREVLLRLNEQVGETCNLSMLDVDAMIYVDRVETQWPLRVQLHVGSRVPLHATSAGKVCLAYMPPAQLDRYLASARLNAYTPATITDTARLREELIRVRECQYGTDTGEFVEGMIAIAVPILDAAGKYLASVSFHAPRQRMTVEDGLIHLDALRQASAELSQLIA